jgi:hypothetical protein
MLQAVLRSVVQCLEGWDEGQRTWRAERAILPCDVYRADKSDQLMQQATLDFSEAPFSGFMIFYVAWPLLKG